jgi:hypothetical protein
VGIAKSYKRTKSAIEKSTLTLISGGNKGVKEVEGGIKTPSTFS